MIHNEKKTKSLSARQKSVATKFGRNPWSCRCESYVFTGIPFVRCTVFRSCTEKRTHHESLESGLSFDLLNPIVISFLMFTSPLILYFSKLKGIVCFVGFNHLNGDPQRNAPLIQHLDIILSERPFKSLSKNRSSKHCCIL